MRKWKQFIGMAGVVIWLLLSACATPPEPYEYKPSNELKPGPGIFTGEEGVLTIYGRPDPAGQTPFDSEEAIPCDPVMYSIDPPSP